MENWLRLRWRIVWLVIACDKCLTCKSEKKRREKPCSMCSEPKIKNFLSTRWVYFSDHFGQWESRAKKWPLVLSTVLHKLSHVEFTWNAKQFFVTLHCCHRDDTLLNYRHRLWLNIFGLLFFSCTCGCFNRNFILLGRLLIGWHYLGLVISKRDQFRR